jgi:glutamate-1-semialdehyde 2,1-aminomutase
MALLDRPVRDFSDAQAADHDLYARFFWEMLDRGVWLPPSGYEAMFLSAAHDKGVLKQVCRAANVAFDVIGGR